MSESLQVEVLSPAKPMASVAATSVSVPASMGYIEILPQHAAIISEVENGALMVTKSDGNMQPFFVAGGYIEVFDNKVTVLADIVEEPSEIDRERAEKARQRALDRLEAKETGTDLQRAQQALARALARILFLDLYNKD